MVNADLVRWFDEVSLSDLTLVGGKVASLGEMIKNLNSAHVQVPFGFALTTKAYTQFLDQNGIKEPIFTRLKTLDPTDLKQLHEASGFIKNLISEGSFDDEMTFTIKKYYEKLNDGRKIRVAVRSSASAEDLPHASFAGQQDTYLHVASFEELISRIKDVYASLFGERAIAYRAHHNFDHEQVMMAVAIQEMVNSDQAVSGVMFSLDPESGFRDAVFINGSFGLGESVVSGSVNPDEFMLYKPALNNNRLILLNQKLGSKAKKLVLNKNGSLEFEPVDKTLAQNFCLADDDLVKLGQSAILIEDHYQRPMDIEWAKDEQSGKLYILQARPETVHSNLKALTTTFSLEEGGQVLCEGRAVGKRVGQGNARLLKDIHEAHDFKKGDILVTDMTDPNWEPVMQKASAIVTNRGGRTCHAAIIARELGIAAVVGCDDATKKIPDREAITVSCIEGDTGKIFKGLLKIEKKEQMVDKKPSPVPLMLIAANPSRALSYHALPHQGIGLARLEFIIANSIKVHPNAILNFESLPETLKEPIANLFGHHKTPVNYYVETLAQGIASLAAVAKPYPIIVRMSDFKTNEYEELLGGQLYEQKENNPMLGFRGAGRYISEHFKDAFALECQALKKARDLGFDNIQVMIPFVRTLKEAELVIAELNKNGLKRGENGLKVIMMCEIPSNVILADEFLDHFDGFSIGSNDLTQLTLGVDRDSHLVAGSFSESDPAMLKMLEQAISACKKRGKYVGICGQGPSDDINLAKKLISLGIDSISLTPDTINDVHQALIK